MPADEVERPDLDRLADLAKRRRLVLALEQPDVARLGGLSVNTVSRIENGRSVSLATLYGLDRGLSWRPGSAEKILGGGDPEELPEKPLDYLRRIVHTMRLDDATKVELILEINRVEAEQQVLAQRVKAAAGASED